LAVLRHAPNQPKVLCNRGREKYASSERREVAGERGNEREGKKEKIAMEKANLSRKKKRKIVGRRALLEKACERDREEGAWIKKREETGRGHSS